MPRGRMVSRSLSTSSKFARLYHAAGKRLGDFAQALYPLLIVHADDFGRMSGDAFTVKHTAHPTSPRPLADFDAALDALARVRLIDRYSTRDGAIVLAIVNFDAHQQGLHHRTSSRWPAPPELPGDSGTFPEILSEEKRREEKKNKYPAPRRARDPHPTQPVENVQVIAQVIVADLLPLGLEALELPEAVKRRCAELHIAYDATTIRKALDVVQHRHRHGDA